MFVAASRRLGHRGRTYSGLLPLLLCIAGSCAAADTADTLSESVLDVTVSAGTPGEMMVVLRGRDGALYLEAGDFALLRLRLPPTPAHEQGGRRYYRLTDIRGSSVSIDEAQQRAVISVPAAAFETSRESAPERQHPSVTPASPGAFLNYQLSAQQIQGQITGGVFGEIGAFASPGVLTNTGIGRYAGGQAQFGGQQQWVRLDTTFTRDFPDQLETLNVGDAISDPGTWGNAVRFAGIRWSRNFALRPDLLTTPLQTAAGTATVPSTVDVFVNNQLVNSSQLPPGPFVINRLPTVTGAGDVSVVVRDALGREQVVTQSFYSSSTLLARGLSQYSVDVGSVRNNYSLTSDDYGAMLGEASYRRGITNSLTLEAHGEVLKNSAHAAGINAAYGIGHYGVVNVTAAGGADAGGAGWLRGIGAERRSAGTSFIANSLWASPDYAQVGEPLEPAFRLRQRSLAQVGQDFGRFGSLSLAYVRQTYRSAPTQQTVSATHALSLGRFGTLNLTVSHTRMDGQFPSNAVPGSGVGGIGGIGGVGATGGFPTLPTGIGQNSTSAFLTYVLPLDNRRAVSATAVNGNGGGGPQNEVIGTLTSSPPVGPGYGYRLSESSAGNYDADWRQQANGAALELEVARNAGIEGRSALMTGALTLLDGQVNATRTVDGSFAMVDVGGIPGLPVYVENQVTTHTDASGRALLFNLRPYEANHISVAPEELPLDTTIGAATDVVAPPFRSGVVVRFPVERTRGGTFRLLMDDGKPVPVGAMVKLKSKLFPVVLDGTVYVTGYDHGEAADATWPGGHCSFRLEPPPPDDPLPDMGTVRCHATHAGVGGGR